MPNNGQEPVQYIRGAHRDLGTDQVGKAQISFNVPVSATSRTAHGRPGLAATADRPGQEGLSARWPLAAGSLCRTFAFSSPGRKEPPSPPAIAITTQHAPSAGRELTRVLNLFRCPRSRTYPEVTLALQLLLQPTPQLRACGLLCAEAARPRWLQELAPILDLRQALSHPGDQTRVDGEGPGLAIACVVGQGPKTAVGLVCPGPYTALSLPWEGSRSRPPAA